MTPARGARLTTAARALCTHCIAVAAWLALSCSADAAFPGANGKLATVSVADNNYEVFSLDPDGTGLMRLTNDPAEDLNPAWSPDGARIAFQSNRDGNRELYVMNADGTNQTRLTTDAASDEDPAWSPDGTKLAFESDRDGNRELYVMNADGTNQIRFTSNASDDRDPAWSPDGTKIAFASNRDPPSCDPEDPNCNPRRLFRPFVTSADGTGAALRVATTNPPSGCGDGQDGLEPEWSPTGSRLSFMTIEYDICSESGETTQNLYTVAANGTALSLLESSLDLGIGPTRTTSAWSPDGAEIAYFDISIAAGHELRAIRADGSSSRAITTGCCTAPNWQPIVRGYPRPKGATPFWTYLTVAYKACTSPNRQHGSPLAVQACNPPQQASDYLTVGTLDVNGQAAKSTGAVYAGVVPGNSATPADEADVNLVVSVKDVRNQSGLTDYSGELAVRTQRRITDRDNTPHPGGPGPGTAQDAALLMTLSVTVPCAPTPDTTIGSLCEITTTADALVPGQVKEGVRSNWQLGQIQVFDGGTDADADTTTDNTLFMDEGIFVP